LPADNPDRVKTGVLYGVKNAETGRVRPIVKFEVIHGGKSGPFDKDAWADRGHLDMPTGFNRAGVEKLLPKTGPINPNVPPPGKGGGGGGGKPGGGGSGPSGSAPPNPGGPGGQGGTTAKAGGGAGSGEPGAGPGGTGVKPPAPSPSTSTGGGRARLLGTIGIGGGMALLGALANSLRSKLDQRLVDKQIKDMEPEIQARAKKLKAERANIQASGRKPWANITVRIMVITSSEFGFGKPIKDATLPTVSLQSVE